MTKQNTHEILTYLSQRKSEALTFLKSLVLEETPSRVPETQEDIFKILQRKLQSLNYYTNRVPGRLTGGYLYARPQWRKKHQPIQLLIGHCDTVWEVGTLDKMPLTEEENKMKGPGVYDMKAGLTQMIFAVETIQALGLDMRLAPVLMINSDEEIGSKESTATIRRLAKIAERAFVMEPPLGLEGKLKTARKGLGRFTLTVSGVAAHAGLDPEKGVNAIVELSHQIQALFAMNDPEKGISVNVGMIEGGTSANVVAPQGKAVVDVRVLNQEDAELITEKIYNLKPTMSGTELHIEGAIGRPPMERTARNRKLWEMAQSKALLLGLELEEGIAGGGSDGNTTSQYTATLDGLGTTGDGAHAKHEYIFTEQLIERTALLTLLLAD